MDDDVETPMARLGRLILLLRALTAVAVLSFGLALFAFSSAFVHSPGFRALAWAGLAAIVLLLASTHMLARRRLQVAR